MIELRRCMRTEIAQRRMAMQEMRRSKRGKVSWIKGCWIDAELPSNVGSSVNSQFSAIAQQVQNRSLMGYAIFQLRNHGSFGQMSPTNGNIMQEQKSKNTLL
jgi:hypothetical protein